MELIEFIKSNYEWLFSGVAVFVLSLLISQRIIKKVRNKKKMIVKDKSSGVLADNINVNVNKKNNNEQKKDTKS